MPASGVDSDFDQFVVCKTILGLRGNEWVHLYLLEHASKDFQTEILLIS